MCGILYCERHDKLPVAKLLKKRFENQKARGLSGFGYIPIENGKVNRIERATTENEIMELLKKETSNAILFHHRKPTSTPNYVETTHPICVENDSLKHNYYVIHNGVLSNEDVLKGEHEKEGFEYTTEYKNIEMIKFFKREYFKTEKVEFNDSEAFAIELALYMENKKKFITARGTISFIAVQTDKKQNVVKILYGHNDGNPLVEERIGNKGGHFVLKSAGEGVQKPANIIYIRDFKTGDVVEEHVDIGYYYFSKPKVTHETENKVGFRQGQGRRNWSQAEQDRMAAIRNSWEKETRTRPVSPSQALLPYVSGVNYEEDDHIIRDAELYWEDHDPDNPLSLKDSKIEEIFSQQGQKKSDDERLQEIEEELSMLDTNLIKAKQDLETWRTFERDSTTPDERAEYASQANLEEVCIDRIKKDMDDLNEEAQVLFLA